MRHLELLHSYDRPFCICTYIYMYICMHNTMCVCTPYVHLSTCPNVHLLASVRTCVCLSMHIAAREQHDDLKTEVCFFWVWHPCNVVPGDSLGRGAGLLQGKEANTSGETMSYITRLGKCPSPKSSYMLPLDEGRQRHFDMTARCLTRELELRTSVLLAIRSPCRFASAVDLANAGVPPPNLCERSSLTCTGDGPFLKHRIGGYLQSPFPEHPTTSILQ